MLRACTTPVECDRTVFMIGEDAPGHYAVRENHGLIGGEFISRSEAMRFARDECEAIPGAVILIADAAAMRGARRGQ
ncbi:hypothetical protein KX816_02580 [Sphingosinicellaceae bacterium]|nr:hypothetical protein KX816_02580 [Sphingosinicellaceae bacterium]